MSLKHTKQAKQKSVTHINSYTFWSTSKFQLASGYTNKYLGEILYGRHTLLINFSPMAQQPLVSQGFLITQASRSHSDTPHSVGLLWTSDQPDAENST